MLLAVGLLPAVLLLAATGYGLLAPNTWEVSASTTTEVSPDVLIDQIEDVRRWADWMFIGEAGGSDFVAVQHEGPQSGPGASTGWMRGFDMGEAVLLSEVEGAGTYAVAFEERRGARPSDDDAVSLTPEEEPSVWVQTEGSVTITRVAGQAEVTFVETGAAGPRPLGPYLLPFVQQRREDLAVKRVQALVEVARAREARQILIPR